jgi:hypothetical protein
VIYRLDFPILHEWNNCNSSNTKILESIHNLLPESLLLYRYKVRKSIVNRFGVNDPEKISFDLIKQNSIIVYHLDIFKEKTTSINDLINFCLETNRDLFIPTQQDRYYGSDGNYRKKHEYKFDIALELDAYDYQYYDMSNDSSLVQLKRELVLSSL